MVHVTGSSGRQQWNRVTTAVGYGSSSDRTVYFGMAQDAIAASVEIIWPSGVHQRQTNVRCDRYLILDEP
jgi:hypothetical protein